MLIQSLERLIVRYLRKRKISNNISYLIKNKAYKKKGTKKMKSYFRFPAINLIRLKLSEYWISCIIFFLIIPHWTNLKIWRVSWTLFLIRHWYSIKYLKQMIFSDLVCRAAAAAIFNHKNHFDESSYIFLLFEMISSLRHFEGFENLSSRWSKIKFKMF